MNCIDECAKLNKELAEITDVLPKTFYAALSTSQRVKLMVVQWNRCISINHQLGAELLEALKIKPGEENNEKSYQK